MIERSLLEKLYQDDKLSMVEIANRLEVSPHKVIWWMEKYQIPRRTWSEATYVKRNGTTDPFEILTKVSTEEIFLYGLGLGLYWGEGTKASLTAVRLGNTDPALLRYFIRFLRKICGVKLKKIRFALQIFEDINEEEAIAYWLKELGVSREQFARKIIISPRQGKGTYHKKSQYGVVTVMVNNKKLRDWLVHKLQQLGLPT
jgi:hypothetical protein